MGIRETFASICMMVSGGLNRGSRSYLCHFLLENDTIESLHISNFNRTRYKIKPSAFQTSFDEYVKFVYSNWDDPRYRKFDRSVIAVDGSKFTLPASELLKDEFDKDSLKLQATRGYYPQCLVTNFHDVYRKIPVKRLVTKSAGCERQELLKGINDLPEKSIILVDRGYYSYNVFYRIQQESEHDILARVPVNSSFKVVKDFSESDKKEAILTIKPTYNFINKMTLEGEDTAKFTPIKIRAIRYTPKGSKEEIILLTTLLDTVKYPLTVLSKLYWKRWQVELCYRDEKYYIGSDDFHSKKVNGVLQELYASVIMILVARYQIYLEEKDVKKNGTLQFLNIITALALRLPRIIKLTSNGAKKFIDKLIRISHGMPNYSQKNRNPYPRMSKSARNKWTDWARSP